jgi:choline dehydrogenase-like flavoprotein
MPVGFAKMTTANLTSDLMTAPQMYTNNREIPYARARLLAVGSSINSEIYIGGHLADYDDWAR